MADELAERVKAAFVRAREKLRELQDERENGDYSIFPAITREEAERAVRSAERFVDAVEAFVQAQGFATEG